MVCSSLVAPSSAYELTVLHTNDLHSRFDEITSRGSACREKDRARGKCLGGVARIKKAVDDIRKTDRHTSNMRLKVSLHFSLRTFFLLCQ